MDDFKNVLEPQIMHDTILVGAGVSGWQFNTGWFTTFAAMAAQTEYPFFNVRNRNSGLAYCNQDTRDQTAYGMQVFQMGVQFFGPQIHSQAFNTTTAQPTDPAVIEEIHTALWETELPRHASITLRVNQDDRLKINCAMVSAGMGPVGGGMGHGDANQEYNMPTSRTEPYYAVMKGCTSNGVAEGSNRWPFAIPLDVPRRATLSAVIRLSEYGRQMLLTMLGPHSYYNPNGEQEGVTKLSCLFGVRVMLTVKRYVQQRGEYHA